MGLGGLVVVMGSGRPPRVGEEDEPAQVVGGLTPVELAADAPSERLVGEPAQRMQGAQQPALLQRPVVPLNPDPRMT